MGYDEDECLICYTLGGGNNPADGDMYICLTCFGEEFTKGCVGRVAYILNHDIKPFEYKQCAGACSTDCTDDEPCMCISSCVCDEMNCVYCGGCYGSELMMRIPGCDTHKKGKKYPNEDKDEF